MPNQSYLSTLYVIIRRDRIILMFSTRSRAEEVMQNYPHPDQVIQRALVRNAHGVYPELITLLAD